MTVSAPAGALGAVTPSREEFRALAVGHRVIPVTRRLLADDETPVGVYRKLAGDRPGTFLLESAENGRSWSRWSFVGAHSAAALTAVDGELTWTGDVPAGLPRTGDPLAALRTVVEELRSERLPGLPPLTGGMVGYLGYDVVRRLERLPELAVDDLRIPELVMLLATDLAAVDHHEGTITLIANAINWDATDERVDEAYDDAVARLDRMTAELAAPAASTVAVYGPAEPRFTRRRSPAEHHAAVEIAKQQIRDGEAFQVVVSQRFETACPAEGLVKTSIRAGSGAFGSGPASPEISVSETLPLTGSEITAPASCGTGTPCSERPSSICSLVDFEIPSMMPVKVSSIRAVVDGRTAGLVNNSIPAGSGAGGCPVGGTASGGPDRLARRCE